MDIKPESKSSEMDLMSSEKLDRASPELWPQAISGLNDYAKTINQNSEIVQNGQSKNSEATQKWMDDLNKNDIEMLNELATLNTPQLVDKVKYLLDNAYQLGLEESNEMTRGRLLNILESKSNN